ncbi:ABC transporter ATP-binding protein [Castellaniella sp.]|uniref:ABC transporter ATP-binding protein n=1 Tax=Castellaniella sp. TaxID=1955812 RepID=UPI003C71C09A
MKAQNMSETYKRDQGPSLEIKDVTYEYVSEHSERTRIFEDINFDIAKREFVSVMGTSGCGKSTLLNIIAGFLPCTSGEVLVSGEPITAPGPDRAMVLQKPALFPWFTALKNVLFGPTALGFDKETSHRQAVELLREVGLAGYENNLPHELSGGMQHRVALARTLAIKAPVLLMDEPFAALDAQTRQSMQDLLLRVWENHQSTVFFVTHDIEEALLLSDRVVILKGRPARIVEIINSPFVRPRESELILDPTFVELRGRIRSLLR